MIRHCSFKLSLLSIVLLGLLFIGSQIRICKQYPDYISHSYVISWDALGYYMYLPATIIYKDPGIEEQVWYNQLNEKYQKDRPQYQFYRSETNRLINVYPAGQSISMLPFFMVAQLVVPFTDYPADGFSAPYQYAAIISGLFFSILGLVIIRRILLEWFNDRFVALLLLLISIGTNQFYYAAFDPISTHNYLFAGNALLLWLTIKWHKQPSLKYGLYIGLLLGWLTITRPSELVLLLLPLLWNVGSFSDFKPKFRLLIERKKDVVALIIGMVVVGSLQLFYWKYTSGHFMSYQHTEGFDFLHPFTLNFLFSFKKGWLIYTPLMVLALAGFFVLRKHQPKLFLPIILFFVTNLWVVSSWECWWYATSWSQRPMIQSYAILLLPLAFLLYEVRKLFWLRIGVYSFAMAAVVLNVFQMWQYREGIISGDRMTGAYYAAVFGKTEIPNGAESLLEIDRWNGIDEKKRNTDYTSTIAYWNDFEKGGIPPEHLCDTNSTGGGKNSLLLSAAYDYAGYWSAPFCSLTSTDHALVRISADVLQRDSLPATNLVFAIKMNGRKDYGYNGSGFSAAALRTGKWEHIRADFITPVILHPCDTLSATVWNAGKTELLIDNVKVEVFVPNNH